jgi:glutamyl-tRNA reductase
VLAYYSADSIATHSEVGRMRLVVVGLNHKTAPVETREQLSIEESQLPKALADLRASVQLSESVILSTCNRTEVYACCAFDSHGDSIAKWLGSYCNLSGESYLAHLYRLQDEKAAHHLFRVASGIDSMVTGEYQVLAQLKNAYTIARESGFTGSVLNYLFHHAISVGKRVRTETAIGRGAFSVGSAAARLAESIFEDLKDCTVMILGAGKMAEQTVAHLMSTGTKNVLVANRTELRAAALATRYGARAVDFDDLEAALPTADIVVASTSAREPIITQDMLKRSIVKRRGRPMFVIDIAVPRNVEPAAANIEGVFLYNIDDLQAVVEKDRIARSAEIERAECIIAQELIRFAERFRSLEAVPVITAIRDKFETIRETEVAKLKRKFPDLSPDQLSGIDAMTRSIVNKICHDPVIRIKEFLSSEECPINADLLCQLFGVCPKDEQSEEVDRT